MPSLETVTIILTTLNSEQYVARSIESCLRQTYANIELLVVDGGSTDRTLEIVAGFDDPRIRVIHQQTNAGKLPGALNLGMANARGEFITWTQDDCWYEADAVQAMVEWLEVNPDVALVYTDYWFVDESGSLIRLQGAEEPEHIEEGGDIVGQCFLFRREVYERVGPQNEAYFPVHEVPWRIGVARAFKIRPLRKALMYYTVHDHSLTGQIGAWQLQRICAQVLLQEGYWDAKTYKRRMAALHVHQAYDDFVLQGDYRAFRSHAFAGLLRNRAHLKNRGLLKLILVSLLPGREHYRTRLSAGWQAATAARFARDLAANPEAKACVEAKDLPGAQTSFAESGFRS